MSLLQTHGAGVLLTAAFASLSLLSCTGLTAADGALTCIAIFAAWYGKRTQRPAWLDARMTPVVLFAMIAVASIVLSASSISMPLLGLRLVWSLWCARLFTARYASHDGQALLLSIMLVCAATVLSPSPWLAPSLLLFVVTLTSTLVTRQLLYDITMRGFVKGDEVVAKQALERKDVLTLPYVAIIATLASLLLVAGALVFACFPRSQAPSASGALSGAGVFPDSVSLTAAPRAHSAGIVLVRATGLTQAQFERGLYLRADVYDAWQDGTFHVAPEVLSRIGAPRPLVDASLSYELRFLSDVFVRLPALGPIDHAGIKWTGLWTPLIVRDAARLDTLMAGGPPRALTIQVTGTLWPDVTSVAPQKECADPASTSDEMNRHLSLPGDIDGRIAPLAQMLVGQSSAPGEKARRLRHYLAANQTYSLTPSGTSTQDPLADFFFGGKAGHCEYFATGYALMLRAVGIPARVVGGLAFGAWDDDTKTAIFRGSHAHAWVEWFDPCRGWLLDDATPPVAGEWLGPWASFAERWRRAWDEHVLSYGADEQWALLQRGATAWAQVTAPFRGLKQSWIWPATSIGAGLIAACISLALGMVWLRVPRGLRFEQRLGRLLEARLVGALGRPLRKQETLGQASRRLGPRGLAALQLVSAYERQRFGGGVTALGASERRALLERAKTLFIGPT